MFCFFCWDTEARCLIFLLWRTESRLFLAQPVVIWYFKGEKPDAFPTSFSDRGSAQATHVCHDLRLLSMYFDACIWQNEYFEIDFFFFFASPVAVKFGVFVGLLIHPSSAWLRATVVILVVSRRFNRVTHCAKAAGIFMNVACGPKLSRFFWGQSEVQSGFTRIISKKRQKNNNLFTQRRFCVCTNTYCKYVACDGILTNYSEKVIVWKMYEVLVDGDVLTKGN